MTLEFKQISEREIRISKFERNRFHTMGVLCKREYNEKWIFSPRSCGFYDFDIEEILQIGNKLREVEK